MTSSQNISNNKAPAATEQSTNTSTSSDAFEQSFDALIKRYISESNDDNQGLLTYFEENWPSPCIEQFNENIQKRVQDEMVNWQPVSRVHPVINEQTAADKSTQSIDLSNLESGLEITLPKEVHSLFCRYFSHDINASAPQGKLTLLQAWNEEDFDRLQKNVIAHVLMKRRLKQADTIFFALTDKEDMLLSVLVETGEVVLEVVGKEPHEVVSPNLTTFLQSLQPKPVLVTL